VRGGTWQQIHKVAGSAQHIPRFSAVRHRLTLNRLPKQQTEQFPAFGDVGAEEGVQIGEASFHLSSEAGHIQLRRADVIQPVQFGNQVLLAGFLILEPGRSVSIDLKGAKMAFFLNENCQGQISLTHTPLETGEMVPTWCQNTLTHHDP